MLYESLEVAVIPVRTNAEPKARDEMIGALTPEANRMRAPEGERCTTEQ